MPTPDTLERFIALVETNAHADAVEAFYTIKVATTPRSAGSSGSTGLTAPPR